MTRPEQFFSEDYFLARDRFRNFAKTAGGQLHSIPLNAAGPNNEELTIDISWFGAPKPRRILLHSSGLHGVEGFAGSAIQLQMLQAAPALPQDAALVVVHTLNPYGMSHLRRVNENNVDLNRNFLTIEDKGTADRLEEVFTVYRQFDRFLNPANPPTRDFFTVKAAVLILRYGMPRLRQAVVGGQYWFPKGLFYGGQLSHGHADFVESERQQGAREYQTFLTTRLDGVERVIAIDVHTGLGKYGVDALLAETQLDRLGTIFGERVIAANLHTGGYAAWGTLGGMVQRVAPAADVLFVTQEFGTYPAVRVVHALREENRWHHYGAGALNHPTKRMLKRTFCPDDPSWREAVLKRGQELISQAVSQLQ
jgi:hypothetical protein